MKDNVTLVEGEVIENLPNTLFRIKLNDSEKIILCYLSGKMRKNYIKILPGDKVRMEKKEPDFGHNSFFAKYDYVFTIKDFHGCYYCMEEDNSFWYLESSIDSLYVEEIFEPIYSRFEILDIREE